MTAQEAQKGRVLLIVVIIIVIIVVVLIVGPRRHDRKL